MPPKPRRPLRWLIGILATLLVLAGAAILCRDPILKLAAIKRIEKSTGLRAEIGTFKTGLRSPVISMQGVRLHHPPGFGPGLLLDAPDLLVEFDPELSQQGKLRFKQLRLHLAELNLIRDEQGRLNVEKLEQDMTDHNAARTNRHEPKLAFAGIDEMRLTLGRVTFLDRQKPSRNREFAVNMRDQVVTGIKTEEDLQDWIGSNIFNVIVQESTAASARKKRKPVETLKEALDR